MRLLSRTKYFLECDCKLNKNYVYYIDLDLNFSILLKLNNAKYLHFFFVSFARSTAIRLVNLFVFDFYGSVNNAHYNFINVWGNLPVLVFKEFSNFPIFILQFQLHFNSRTHAQPPTQYIIYHWKVSKVTFFYRQFLWSFRLPGEAQKIDRMMECFAKRYCDCQGDNNIFENSDTCYVLSFAIIMLNTSLHNPSVKEKPSIEQFINMNRGINMGNDLPKELLVVSFKIFKFSHFVTSPFLSICRVCTIA